MEFFRAVVVFCVRAIVDYFGEHFFESYALWNIIVKLNFLCNINQSVGSQIKLYQGFNMMPKKSRSPHNTFNLPLEQNLELQISSDFDEGNLEAARIMDHPQNYKNSDKTNDLFVKMEVFAAPEPFNPQCSAKQSSKNLFNFSVRLNSFQSVSDNIWSEFPKENHNEITKKKNENMTDRYQILPVSNLTQQYQHASSLQDGQDQQKLNGWEQKLQIFDENQFEISNLKSNIPMAAIELQIHIHKLNYVLGMEPHTFLQYYAICIGRQCGNSSDEEQTEVVYNKTKLKDINLKKLQDNTYTLIFKYRYELQYQQDEVRAFKNKEIPLLKSQPIYFAYHYPYSNEKLARYLLRLQTKIQTKNSSNPEMKIYYQKQTLTFSKEKRPVRLLTITGLVQNEAPDSYQEEEKILDFLQPDLKENQKRSLNFRKPYIVVTCRVHSGQTSASFALEGLINKLIDCSPESQFLLKMFTFKIVPIINVDGVYHGTYRMNPQGQNLNRFYDIATLENQPQIYAVQSLLHHYTSGNNILQIYIDFHSHAKPISSFIYGNIYPAISEQVETQALTRVLSQINPCFSEDSSVFSEKNMNNKDGIQLMDKSGSGRLCAYRLMKGLPHCYTLEMGYLGSKIGNTRKNSNLQCQQEEFQTISSNQPNRASKENLKVFTIKDYENVGSSLLQTIAQFYTISLQVLIKPKNCPQPYLNHLRQSLQKQLKNKKQRFKTKQLPSDINDAILNNVYRKLIKAYPKTVKYVYQYFFSVQSSSITQAMTSKYPTKKVGDKRIFKKSLTVKCSPRQNGVIQDKKQGLCEKKPLNPIVFGLDPSKTKKIIFNQTTNDWVSPTLSTTKDKVHKKKFEIGRISSNNSEGPKFRNLDHTAKEIRCHGRTYYHEKKYVGYQHTEDLPIGDNIKFSKQLAPQSSQFRKIEVESKYSQVSSRSTYYKIKTPQNTHHKCIKRVQAQKEHVFEQNQKVSSLEYVFGEDGVQRISSPHKSARSPSGKNAHNTLLPKLELLRQQKRKDSSCEKQGICSKISPKKIGQEPQQNYFKIIKIKKER